MKIRTRLLACAAPIVAAIGAASGTASATPAMTAAPAQVATDGADSACETANNLGDIVSTPLPDNCALPPTPHA